MQLHLARTFCQENSAEKSLVIDKHENYPYKSFIYNGSITDCDCSDKVCIRKCCEKGYDFEDTICVYNSSSIMFDIYDGEILVDQTRQNIIAGTVKCPNNFYRLDPNDLPEDEFFLQKDGRLWVPDYDNYISSDQYCLESTDGNIWAVVCVPSITRTEQTINNAGMIISMPFLLVTFIIYALLPEKNIHGKSLMCYVLSLFLAYVLLCIINSMNMHPIVCVTSGLTFLQFFTASFFWMNVMSIDIWWTFRGSRDLSGNTKAAARKQFIIYSIYAWGVPFVLVLIVGFINTFSDPTSWYHPKIGAGLCWIKDNVPLLMYLYAPLALMIILNIVFFVITAIKIRKLQKDTAMLRSTQYKKHTDEEQKRFHLYIKLSLAMGVNWITEIVYFAVSWQIGSVPPSVWYLTDFCNAIYGVIIFFIFAFKKKIWITLKNRYKCYKTKSKPRESPCTTTESAM
ncbi:hypothetical protein FQR65_LT11132 [Abscondita terminalis]|nr:hypothetical protein FQR65_LT11132 [Abscondita terminalis]